MSSGSTHWNRLKGRLNYGLLIQELLDRLAKIGLTCYPYYVVREMPLRRPELDADAEGLEARFLNESELSLVSDIPERPRDLSRLRARRRYGDCFGVWVDGEFAAFSWYSSKEIPAAVGGQPLCPLPPHTLYLYDAFVRPGFRGRQVAGYMRHRLHEALHKDGAQCCASISLAFNKSTRRFKAKLGAEETELRLLLALKNFVGVDFRIRRTISFIDAPRFMVLRRLNEPRL
jgi:ribosomal protein S18 acetylase RimI-like enzyme